MRWVEALILVIFMTGAGETSQEISVAIPGMGTTGPYRLGHTHILTGSESVFIQDKLLSRTDDYRIEYNDGFIVLNRPLPVSDTLNVRFSVVPITLRQSYRWYEPKAITDSDTVKIDSPVKPKRWGDQLDIIGSKGFAINIGNVGEPSLTQSLDLDISGEISRGVHVRGNISDRNFATSSQGGTSSLDELDKIFISLEARGFRGDFGDLELEGIDNSLLDFRRKLTGLSVAGEIGNYRGSSALAFSPGTQIEFFFYGTDGKQGPYILSGREISSSPAAGNVFIPGTEEVYLDGRKLKRGNENDYNIDYFERFIEFMPKNIISSKSRITVKIQFAPEGYRRSFYQAKTFREGIFTIGVQYVGEKDDKSNPRNFELGEPERLAISNAGAFQDSSYSSGVKYAGSEAGDYVLVLDSLGNDYYEYVGADQGDYQVSFSRIGPGLGDYEYAGAGRYLYVGRGNGAYLPVIFYPLPESRDYCSVIFSRAGNLYFDGELAVSRHDRNTLSQKDDLFTGLGFLGTTGIKTDIKQLLGKSWDIDLARLSVRSLDKRFSVPGIIDPPEFFRRYNLPQNRILTEERLIEFESGAASSAGDNVKAGGGYFDGQAYKARRGFGQVKLSAFEKLGLAANAELSRSESKDSVRISDWNKYDASIEVTDGRFRPGAAVRIEFNDGLLNRSDGYKANEYETFLSIYPSPKIVTRSRALYRLQQYNNLNQDNSAAWDDHYKQYQLEQGVAYGGSGSGFNGDLNLSRLYQKRYYPLDEKIIRNMGDLKVNYSRADYGITYYESVNGTGRIQRAREYVFVGDGKGDFRKDGEDYVPEPGGDYIEIIRQLSELDTETGAQTGYEISSGLRIRLDGKAFDKNGLISRISYDNDLTHRISLGAGSRLRTEHLMPLVKYNPEEMTVRIFAYRQRTTFKFNQTGDYLRHTLKSSRDNGSDFLFENANLNNKALSNSADLKILTRRLLSFLISAELASDTRWLYSGNVDLNRIKTGLVPEIRPSRTVKIEIPLEYAGEDEKIRGLKIQSYSIGLRSILNFSKFGRLEFDGGYTRVETDRQNIFLPYVAAGGRKEGDNYNGLISARFKLNSYSRIELRYSYRKLGDGYTNNNLRLEAKAEF